MAIGTAPGLAVTNDPFDPRRSKGAPLRPEEGTVSVEMTGALSIDKTVFMGNFLSSGIVLALAPADQQFLMDKFDSDKTITSEVAKAMVNVLKGNPRLQSFFRHHWTPEYFVRCLLRNEGPSCQMFEAQHLKAKSGAAALVVVFGDKNGPVGGEDTGALVGRGGFSYIRRALVEDRTDKCFIVKASKNPSKKALVGDVNEAGFAKKLDGKGAAELESTHELFDAAGNVTELWLIYEHLEGSTLKEIGKLPSREFANRALLGPANALQALHERGVAHLDFGPRNILIASAKNQGKLLDIGGGKNRNQQSKGEANILTGTPGYIAYEIIQGGNEAATEQSDVFSLGATLYLARTDNEMFGKTFKGKGMEIFREPTLADDMANEQAANIATLRAGDADDKALADALEHMLARDPTKRWTIKQAIDWLVQDTYGPKYAEGKKKLSDDQKFNMPGKGAPPIRPDQTFPLISRYWHPTHAGLNTRDALIQQWDQELLDRQTRARNRLLALAGGIAAGIGLLVAGAMMWYNEKFGDPPHVDPVDPTQLVPVVAPNVVGNAAKHGVYFTRKLDADTKETSGSIRMYDKNFWAREESVDASKLKLEELNKGMMGFEYTRGNLTARHWIDGLLIVPDLRKDNEGKQKNPPDWYAFAHPKFENLRIATACGKKGDRVLPYVGHKTHPVVRAFFNGFPTDGVGLEGPADTTGFPAHYNHPASAWNDIYVGSINQFNNPPKKNGAPPKNSPKQPQKTSMAPRSGLDRFTDGLQEVSMEAPADPWIRVKNGIRGRVANRLDRRIEASDAT